MNSEQHLAKATAERSSHTDSAGPKKSPLLKTIVVACALTCAVPAGSSAALVTLNQVGSFAFANAFGLAFDGVNLQVLANGSPLIREMSTSGVLTGGTTPNPVGLSALAWSGTQLLGATGNQVRFFDRTTGANQTVLTLQGVVAGFPIDGLDFDHNEIYWSDDVGSAQGGALYRFKADGTLLGVNPIPLAPGHFSGFERVDTLCLGTLIFAVNDAPGVNPRRLTVGTLDGAFLGDAAFANDRYEDLAFDGTFLYAADRGGGKIDKFEVLIDGCAVTSAMPEPSTGLAGCILAGFIGLYSFRREGRALRA